MALDHKDIQAAIDGPPPTHVRNINVDTHIGQAPQRPYALLEDQMARVVGGYRTVADLQQALAGQERAPGLPDGAPDPNEVVDEGGSLYRYVVSQEPRAFVVRDGALMEDIVFERRAVSLSMEGARTASQNGTPTDYWNGFTWLRDGWKPERDFQVIASGRATDGAQRVVVSAPASPTDTARLQHEVNRMNLAQPPVPTEAPARAESRKAAARKED